MKIKTLQWNIGGAIIRDINSDASLSDSYSIESIDYIINYINDLSPDLITIQESHSNNLTSQGKEISKRTNLKYYMDFIQTDSHLKKSEKLTLSILSNYPIQSSKYINFMNPNWKLIRSNGDIWYSHDKGIGFAEVEIEGKTLLIETLQLMPFRKYEKDILSEELEIVKTDISSKIFNNLAHERVLIQGDFNLNFQSLKDVFNQISEDKFLEIEIFQDTTPRGRKYDHIIYKGIKLLSFKIDSEILTDHYSLVCEFEI